MAGFPRPSIEIESEVNRLKICGSVSITFTVLIVYTIIIHSPHTKAILNETEQATATAPTLLFK